jgi:DNA-directed RNA polymerase specialized sigma24 family protein
MTAKQFLKQYEEANNKAIQRRREYERQMALIGSVSVKMDGMPHGSGISKPTENDAIKLSEKAENLRKAERDAIRIRQEVYDVIDGIPDIEGRVLYERYINFHKWEEICILLHYSWNGIHHVHRRALEAVEMVLNGTHNM